MEKLPPPRINVQSSVNSQMKGPISNQELGTWRWGRAGASVDHPETGWHSGPCVLQQPESPVTSHSCPHHLHDQFLLTGLLLQWRNVTRPKACITCQAVPTLLWKICIYGLNPCVSQLFVIPVLHVKLLKQLLMTSVLQKALSVAEMARTDTELKFQHTQVVAEWF